GHRKPVSMHAEMHAIFTATGMSPAFRKQVAIKNKQSTSTAFDPPLEPPRRLSAGPRPHTFTSSRNGASEFDDWEEWEEEGFSRFSGRRGGVHQQRFQRRQSKVCQERSTKGEEEEEESSQRYQRQRHFHYL